MRTPEQIADAIIEDATGISASNGTPVGDLEASLDGGQIDGNTIRDMLITAARKAQREAEPQFAPEGEPDDWRDDAENMGDTDRVLVGWRVVSEDERIVWIDTDFELTIDQARHILVYLSEQARS